MVWNNLKWQYRFIIDLDLDIWKVWLEMKTGRDESRILIHFSPFNGTSLKHPPALGNLPLIHNLWTHLDMCLPIVQKSHSPPNMDDVIFYFSCHIFHDTSSDFQWYICYTLTARQGWFPAAEPSNGARYEGIFCGTSGGATVATALEADTEGMCNPLPMPRT